MNLGDIGNKLRDEESRLAAEKGRLAGELKTIEGELKRIQTALSALGIKRKGSGTKGEVKTAPSKEDVREFVTQVLAERGELSEKALKCEVEKRVSAAGFSRMGFALRFRETLRDEDFERTENGYSVLTTDRR